VADWAYPNPIRGHSGRLSGFVSALAIATDAPGNPLPFRPVPCIESRKSVRNLVQHSVSHFVFRHESGEVAAQRNGLGVELCLTSPLLCPVKLENPVSYSVSNHQHLGLSLSLEEVHRLALSVDLLDASLPA
jgi:hypothetical protein